MRPGLFRLPERGLFSPNSEVDPLRFYYQPLVGRLFAARLEVGLELLGEERFTRLLEIGYGSGLLIPTLAALTDELYGVDREPEPPGLGALLTRLEIRVELTRADAQSLPFPEDKFDGAVAFSILEHLDSAELVRAASEIARVLAPGSRFLVGCPAVHKAMNLAFGAIGFAGIEAHHKSSIGDVVAACEPYFTVERRAALPRLMKRAPLGWAPYSAVLLRRR